MDIILESLESKAAWADFVYVYDTGSTDGTWEIVQEFAKKKDARIVPFKREEVLFREGVRAYVFNAFRDNMEDGDWIVKSDEDEFYHVSPREFVSNHLKAHETAVWTQLYDFRLTCEEAQRQSDPECVARERKIPLINRRRYYLPITYSEHRLCRYRKHMKWYPSDSFPTNAGFVARARIPVRHYPHRDVEQLKHRVRLRQALLKVLPAGTYPHWRCETWEDFLVPANLPELRFWPLAWRSLTGILVFDAFAKMVETRSAVGVASLCRADLRQNAPALCFQLHPGVIARASQGGVVLKHQLGLGG
ncbi:MAG: glycosyltransferase family 2 protein [Acidobacteria bacterium]|nr:glycosyltransferase family 2 protein [Acidobacteriota bacterium]